MSNQSMEIIRLNKRFYVRIKQNKIEEVKELISNNPEFLNKVYSDTIPLTYAMLHNHRELFEELVDMSADVNTEISDRGPNATTALVVSIGIGDEYFFNRLLELGADPQKGLNEISRIRFHPISNPKHVEMYIRMEEILQEAKNR